MIFTNGAQDSVRDAFYKFTKKSCGVFLACPFFTNAELVREIAQKGCTVRLLVRLASATDPDALRAMLDLNIPVRFFTSSLFHSKLYIFGEEIALVGSAICNGRTVKALRYLGFDVKTF